MKICNVQQVDKIKELGFLDCFAQLLSNENHKIVEVALTGINNMANKDPINDAHLKAIIEELQEKGTIEEIKELETHDCEGFVVKLEHYCG